MATLQNLHILIAEDDSDDADIIYNSFDKHPNFKKVSMVPNGEQLLLYLNDTSNELPDVLLTDINMPIVDGIEALQAILADDRLKDIPCFVYSTSKNAAYMENCEKLGVKAYLIKPFSFQGFDQIPDTILKAITVG